MTQHDPEDRTGSSPAVGSTVVPSPEKTRKALLDRAKRIKTPIRKTFVQRPQGEPTRPSVLSTFVHKGDIRALNAYLFLMAINSSGAHDDGWSTTMELTVWARAFGTTKDASPTSATSAVSKILTRLEDRRLIDRERSGRARKVRVTILREDGSGDPYTHPADEDKTDPEHHYLNLPHEYWTEGWHENLTLPAIAMLLVALHAKPVFQLATEHVPKWYGWSADTAERGFDELARKGLLSKTSRIKEAPLAPLGFTTYNEYELTGDFKRRATKNAAAKKTPAKKTPGKKASGASTSTKKTAVKKTARSKPIKKTASSSSASTRKKSKS